MLNSQNKIVEKTKCRMKWCYYPGRREDGECDKFCFYNTHERLPKWLYNPKKISALHWLVWQCEACGESQEHTTPFCPMCGARMEKVDEYAIRPTLESNQKEV